MTHPNPSTAMASVVADELHRHGVRYAVISPGSRSAALAIALDGHPGITTVVVLDERSAAFHALGRAKASAEPVAVLATSGTAVANFHPAVVEANLSLAPLLLLTSDRPAELIGVGANQTIDQVKLFGEEVRWFAQLGPPDGATDIDRLWRTLVSQAVARAKGHGSSPGPVQLNLAFREPTVPVSDDGRTRVDPFSEPVPGRSGSAPWQETIQAPPRPARLDLPPATRALVVAGEGDYDRGTLLAAAAEREWPVLATALSGLRGGEVVTTYHHLLVDGVPAPLTPDLLFVVGRVGPSDRLGWFPGLVAPRVHVDRWGVWYDPWRQATHLVQADPVATLAGVDGFPQPGWRERWLAADRAMRTALDHALEESGSATGPGVARALAGVPAARLVVASSMPIRDVDAHTVASTGIVANRGASGIDGFVSTAFGVASTGEPTLALSGDLSLLHDLAGFVTDPRPDLVMVVVDNGGGGLFDLLPQAEHAPGYQRLFVTPHHLDLVAVVRALGVEAARVGEPDQLPTEVLARLGRGGTHGLVVPVDRGEDLALRRRLDQAARRTLAGLS